MSKHKKGSNEPKKYSIEKLRELFEEWSGFKLEANSLEEAKGEIDNMEDTLSTEVSDYARKLTDIAKSIWKEE